MFRLREVTLKTAASVMIHVFALGLNGALASPDTIRFLLCPWTAPCYL